MRRWARIVVTWLGAALATGCSDDPRPAHLAPEPSGCERLSVGCYRSYSITAEGTPWHSARAQVSDIDADGHLDVVQFESNAGFVLGRGDGTFGSRQSFLAAGGGGNAAIGDLDGDGHPDVVTGRLAVIFGGEPSVLPTPTTPRQFQRPRRLARARWLGPGREAVAVADLDGDLVLLEDLGRGHFDERWRATLGEPVDLAAIQLSAEPDAAPGLAVADLDGAVWWLSPNQAGALDPDSRVVIDEGQRPRALASSDLDGDGRDELAVAFEGEPRVRIYAAASAQPPIEFQLNAELLLPTGSRDLEFVDLDDDGNLDLLALASEGFDLLVHHGLGDGGFAAPQQWLMGYHPYELASLDVDGDGQLDVAALTGNDQLALRRGDGLGGLGELTLHAVDSDWPGGPGILVVAQAQPGAGQELIVAFEIDYSEPLTRLAVHAWVDGELTLGLQQQLELVLGDVITTELDGDGLPDLLGLSRTHGVLVSLFHGGLTNPDNPAQLIERFEPSPPLMPSSYFTWPVVSLDLDGDDDLDVVAGAAVPAIFENLGDGELVLHQQGTQAGCPEFAAAGDFDEDGQQDVTVIDTGCEFMVRVFLGDSAGGLVLAQELSLVGDGGSLLGAGDRSGLGDLDGDGDLDLVTIMFEQRAELLLGRGDGSFEHVSAELEFTPRMLELADADLDGSDELWLAGYDEAFVRLMQLSADHRLVHRFSLTLPDPPWGILVADFNEDSYPDVIAYQPNPSPGWVQGWISSP